MPPPKIYAFVEGQGDVQAVPILAKRMLKERVGDGFASNPVEIVERAWRVGHISKLRKARGAEWERFVKAAAGQRAAGILLVLDGDSLGSQCPFKVAQELVEVARNVGAGRGFSVAVVFAVWEIESWFLADAPEIIRRSGYRVSEAGREQAPPAGDLEKSPRDAKGWLNRNMAEGYKETIHQVEFAKYLALAKVGQRQPLSRSFQRMESAVMQLYNAAISGNHIATP